jgi:hypothetical protein
MAGNFTMTMHQHLTSKEDFGQVSIDFLFPKLKNHLQGCHFNFVEDIKQNKIMVLTRISEDLKISFLSWQHCWMILSI